jgi:hypothetical protein
MKVEELIEEKNKDKNQEFSNRGILALKLYQTIAN